MLQLLNQIRFCPAQFSGEPIVFCNFLGETIKLLLARYGEALQIRFLQLFYVLVGILLVEIGITGIRARHPFAVGNVSILAIVAKRNGVWFEAGRNQTYYFRVKGNSGNDRDRVGAAQRDIKGVAIR